MHTMLRRALLLSERLLPEAAALPAAVRETAMLQRLLPEAAAVSAAMRKAVLLQRLLQETVSGVLLGGEPGILSLSAVQLPAGVETDHGATEMLAAVCRTIENCPVMAHGIQERLSGGC